MRTIRFTKLSDQGLLLPDDATEWAIVRQEIGGEILEWSREDVPGERMSWADAHEAVKTFRLGGHDDWRLPTVEQLFLLADRTRYEPAIDTKYFPSCKPNAYWSSTPDASSPSDYAWCVYFGDSDSHCGYRSDGYFVRAVRSGER